MVTKIVGDMIATDTVVAGNIAAGAVGASEIATGAVGSDEIAADAVGSSEIAAGAVGADELASTLDLSGKTLTLRAGWTYGAQVATTSGTTVELSTAIPDWATEIEILFSGVSTNTANQPPLVQLGYAGPSWQTSGYTGSILSGTSASTANNAFGAGFLFMSTASTDAADVFTSVMRLSRWDAAEHIWMAQGNGSDNAVTACMAGQVTVAGAVDRIRLNTPGGTATFDAGEARIRYR